MSATRKIEDAERGKRLLLAHSFVDQRYGRHLPNGVYGELIAKGYKRKTGKERKFNHSTVREWERGEYAPDTDVFWVIGELSGIHFAWLEHGDASGIPGPLRKSK
jgi:hypothetical protein